MAHNRDYRIPYRQFHGDGPYICAYCDRSMDSLEVVHHVDEDHFNNAIENLQAMHTVCHNKHHHIGLTHTEADKQKIGQGVSRAYIEGRRVAPDMRGEKNPFYGRKHTEEAKAKVRVSRLGKPMSDATKAKITAAVRARANLPPGIRSRITLNNLEHKGWR